MKSILVSSILSLTLLNTSIAFVPAATQNEANISNSVTVKNIAINAEYNPRKLDLGIDQISDNLDVVTKYTAQKNEEARQIEESRVRLENEAKAAEAERVAAEEARTNKVAAASRAKTLSEVAPEPISFGGDKASWLRDSGIAESDWGHVDYIINRESGWNPYAVNASSGAGGLPQALPYSKTGCATGDAVCQLKWADGYAVGRYGSWAGAHTFWLNHNWW
jgi:soluble lytic murein transglycosylase-like protein